ncbi:adenylate cyclase [Rhizobium sp. RU20A]|nr:adenylate cyclase [Rhizobium sp. RU20A]
MGDLLERPREAFSDALLGIIEPPAAPEIVVVDIDRKAIQGLPDQDWNRADTATLLSRLAALKPKVVALDFVFSSGCVSPDASNGALGDAIGAVPTVLGFLIAETVREAPRPIPPLAVRKPLSVPDLWFIDGAETSCGPLMDRSRAAASAFLVGDEDARIRRVQPYAVLGQAAYPTLALEAVRQVTGGTPILGGAPLWLRLNRTVFDLDADGSLRFAPGDAKALAARTISASDLLGGEADAGRLAGKLVFVGSSLPHLGGLRPTASMPLEPSVQIHADIANSLLTGFVPRRTLWQTPAESLGALILGLAVAFAALRLRPLTAAGLGFGFVLAVTGAAAGIYATSAVLVDAIGLSLAVIAPLLLTGTLQFARIRRQEAKARSKFSQYLPSSVVNRFMDEAGDGGIVGEEREVTAFFTDIEGFSTLAQRHGPRELIALLDIYFAEVTAIVARHGGMVDKIVGDAVHALFNAPEDLPDHVQHALDCAAEVERVTQAMCRRPEFAARGFGRTRIGIETGMAVLGEVGAGGKLDYTAHGDAVNLAARLQDANKFLGTSVCIGPVAAARSGRPLTPLGRHEIRGFGEMALFTNRAPAAS